MPRRERSTRPAQRDAAVRIVARLRDAGHTAYLAGGCVRDALLDIEPKDYDIATDARPERVRELLPRSRAVGEAFGVILVYLSGWPIEVATFRAESGYADGRRPDAVHFTDAEHDAQRRDFTINGLFADPLETDPATGRDRIIDYVAGQADLAAHLVRAIGEPAHRFGEDYLRMLRAPRFAARLGFEIEPGTAAAIRAEASSLARISRERIGHEVEAMLTGRHPARAAALIQSLALDAPTLTEPAADVPLPTLAALEVADAGRYPTRLAAWMIDRHADGRPLAAAARFAHDAGPVVARWRAALNLTNRHREALHRVLDLLLRTAAWPELPVARRKRLLGERDWPEARALLSALDADDALARIDADAQPLVQTGLAPTPLVTGQDLIELGLTPGPRFGQLLEAIYDAQLDGRVTTRDDALAWIRQHR
ncbi:MAG: CCA tRNA nucleotidyltransferase [Phycisphaeraceae bacterium]